jgi:undecaprenyl diphosphate synthase
MTEQTKVLNNALPQHVGIIMDGNGRWAERQGKPRVWGHKKGVDAVRRAVSLCRKLDIPSLTLFAFSS